MCFGFLFGDRTLTSDTDAKSLILPHRKGHSCYVKSKDSICLLLRVSKYYLFDLQGKMFIVKRWNNHAQTALMLAQCYTSNHQEYGHQLQQIYSTDDDSHLIQFD